VTGATRRSGPRALYVIPAAPIGPGGYGEPDWAADDLLGRGP
jgi:hypothetical protein